ncbi:traB domain-containing protein isoform X2 [Prionailurus bengalensis]|uniref:traB domain-containing protein isoform X2 n=1 Tax=Prionailurus bengalensis TaxID=37029 RepID=UPI001CA7E546|nr:traB domain-containing protein isoform X2 [Prionailurus bengalensis]
MEPDKGPSSRLPCWAGSGAWGLGGRGGRSSSDRSAPPLQLQAPLPVCISVGTLHGGVLSFCEAGRRGFGDPGQEVNPVCSLLLRDHRPEGQEPGPASHWPYHLPFLLVKVWEKCAAPGKRVSLISARSCLPAMEGEEERSPQEADTEPVVPVGSSEVVPRVLSGEPQNLSDADALSLLLEMKLRRRRERPSLPRTVTELVAEDGSRVYVVGTAHFSDDSKRDVVKTIREVQPDVVVVELCQYRVSMLKMDESTLLQEAKEISLEKLQQAVRQNGVMSGLMQMLLLKVSAHITEQLGMAPGGEFRAAFKEASKVPFCKFHLGDRPIPVTFKRAIAALSFWQKVKLAWGLCFLSDPSARTTWSAASKRTCWSR